MLVTKNARKTKDVIYACDRCGTEVDTLQNKRICVGTYLETPKKKWDLCPRCYKALERNLSTRKNNN